MLTWRTHTENLLWGYHFNIREERCLIRKAAGEELKTSDKLISIQDSFQGAFAGLNAANFDFVFLLTVRANVFQALYMSRQRDSFPGVCAGLFTTWTVTLFDTDTLSQGPETGSPPKHPRQWRRKDVSMAHTHTEIHTHRMWQTLCQSRHSVGLISPPDACPIMTFSSTCALAAQFLKQC